MSRQFDENMEDKFEYQGELKSLIFPTSFSELVEALGIRNTLQSIIDFATHEEDTSGYEEMRERQNDYIQEYLSLIGDFDNSVLVSNIIHLAKSNDIRLGELEKMLGISTGYISRTAKENTNKRLSIDVVWKIAHFFNVSIDGLVNHNLRLPSETTAILCRFVAKLLDQTTMDEIEWNCEGGYAYESSLLLQSMTLLTEDADGIVVYHPEHMNQSYKWSLADDVYSCDAINDGEKLVIIAFHADEAKEHCHYDFFFCAPNENGTYSWRTAFYTSDPFSSLEEQSASLFNQITKKVDAVKLSPDIRSIVLAYLQ